MRLLDFCDYDPMLEEHGGRERQNRDVHKHRAVEGDSRIDEIEMAGDAFIGFT